MIFYETNRRNNGKIILNLFTQYKMLEKVEENQKVAVPLERKNPKSIKPLFNSKIKSRAPSREFNDPIYAGFDINEQNKQQVNWGPWIISNEATMRHSHSLHSSIKKMNSHEPFHSLSVSKKNFVPLGYDYKIRTPSRNQLPEIKQKGKANFLQIKLGQSDQSKLQLSRNPPMKELTFKPKINVSKSDKTFFRRPQEQYKHRLKLGTVVYNYCTNTNVDQCLLNYHRKSEPYLEKFHQQTILTKYEGLKAFWSKKNSMKNN